jgi:DNA-binding transcriptional LysR family regulator
VRVSDFHTKLLAIRQGVGFGWMPEHLVSEGLERGELARVALTEGNHWTYAPHLVERSGDPLGRAARFLVALLLADAKGQPMGDVALA